MSKEIDCKASKPVIVGFFSHFSFKSFEEFSILKFTFAMTQSMGYASESFIKKKKTKKTQTKKPVHFYK